MNAIFSRMVRALSFDERLYREIAGDSSAIMQAATIVMLGAIAQVIGLQGGDPRCFLIFMVHRLVWWLVISVLIFIVGHRLFPPKLTDYGANQPGPDLFKVIRVIGFTMTPRLFLIASLVPFIGYALRLGIIPFWWIGLMIIAVKNLFGYDEVTRAALVGGVGFIPLMLIEPFIFSVGAGGTC